MPNKKPKPVGRLVGSVASIGIVGSLLLAIRIEETDSSRFIFLYWNLILAFIPLLLAWYLVVRLKTNAWLHPKQVALTLAWLFFLPNSFYLLSDYVHLRPTYEADFLYDIVVISSFAIGGMALGFFSLFLVHKELIKRVNYRHGWYMVAGILALSSFAIYLGRFSRWNTWDVLLAPAGLLFDVSDRVVNPTSHSETYAVTVTVFLLLLSVYWAIWESAEYLKG